MRALPMIIPALVLAGCGNPGDISDADYKAYQQLGAPKILYSCNEGQETLGANPDILLECLKITDNSPQGLEKQIACVKRAEREVKPIINVGYAAGVGAAVTYNKLLADTKAKCKGEFKVLESKSVEVAT